MSMSTLLKTSVMTIAALLAGLLIFGGWFYSTIPKAPTPPDAIGAGEAAEPVDHPDIRRELVRRGWVDQTLREEMSDALPQTGTLSGGQMLTAARYFLVQKRVDHANTEALRTIIDRIGWPVPDAVGEEAAQAAFLIAQHADHDRAFQRRALQLLRDAYERGEAPGASVAMLTDRLRVADDRPQVYGTQAAIVDGSIEFAPIEDRATVDARRADMGLPSLDEYLDALKKTY